MTEFVHTRPQHVHFTYSLIRRALSSHPPYLLARVGCVACAVLALLHRVPGVLLPSTLSCCHAWI